MLIQFLPAQQFAAIMQSHNALLEKVFQSPLAKLDQSLLAQLTEADIRRLKGVARAGRFDQLRQQLSDRLDLMGVPLEERPPLFDFFSRVFSAVQVSPNVGTRQYTRRHDSKEDVVVII